MPEKLELIDAENIPSLVRGKRGRNWGELLEQIPVGQAWVVPKGHSASATIRKAVANLNEELEVTAYQVTQRINKETEETTIYVLRLK